MARATSVGSGGVRPALATSRASAAAAISAALRSV
jgi:hypothetical protein